MTLALVLAQQQEINGIVGTSWPEAIFISVAIASGVVLLCVIVWQVFLTARRSIDAKLTREAQDELRAIAQRATAANETTATELAQIAQGITDLRVRLIEIEKVLREVE